MSTTTTPLSDVTVLAFESRLSDSMAKLLKRQGADAISAPSMQEVPLENHTAVFTFAEKLFAGDIEILIFTTGVGTDMMIKSLETRHDLNDILDALNKVTIVSRGPKPAKVLRKHDVSIEVKVPEPNTWKEILEAMAQNEKTSNLDGKRVALQEYGESNEKLNRKLREQGCQLLQVPIYRWSLPDDLEPLKNGIREIINGGVDAVLFTSKTQVNHVMKVAEKIASRETVRKALNDTWVASIGPVCSGGLKAHGIEVDFEPSRPKLGIFINEIAEQLPKRIN